METATSKKHYRSCHLCEAICGVVIETQGEKILSIRGDKDDPFSRGHICPKATALQDLHEDPDRLKHPIMKVDGKWHEISWQEAFETIADRIVNIQERNGSDSVAFFAGNPGVHNYGTMTHGSQLRNAVGTKNHYSATSLDQLPHMLVAHLLYGHQYLIPVPDIDNSRFMLILGANPLASNGSMMTVPDVKNRLKGIQKRGGRFVVVDPRRSETADIADQHHFIKPGSDAYLLLGMIHTLFDEDLINTGHLSNILEGLEGVQQAVAPFTPEVAAKETGISGADIRALAREMAATDGAVCYGRMGVSTQEYGTLCQWAIQVLNALTNSLDVAGGAIVPTPAFGNISANSKGRGYFATEHSRVSGLPKFSGEFPAVAMAEEILTPGEGQIKALFTIATNPVLSAPNSDDVEKALESLDFMVSIDLYLNETTRHADIILPPTSALEHDHYDISFNRLAVRNITRYNEPVFKPAQGTLHDWQIMNGLADAIASKKGVAFKPLPSPDILIDQGITHGPYGKATGADLGLDLEEVRKHPHGLDLGPLKPGLPERLAGQTPTLKLDNDLMIADIDRLLSTKTDLKEDEFLLIGRRHVRSNNSWMHNSTRLVKGPPRWHLLMHPDDMEKMAISDQAEVKISSRTGSVKTTVSASTEVMKGVVSLPHGWGHKKKGIRLSVASKQDGVNCNILVDDKLIDKLSGNAALNGTPVRIEMA